jgi:pimeloyl-ACP methyl ester carboxylesterase
VPITQAAEYRPDKIETLVYLAAFLPQNGRSLSELSKEDKGSAVPAGRIISGDGTYTTMKPEALKYTFYGDCSEEDISLAKASLTPQPLSPGATPVRTTKENFGRVPRVYMTALFDRAVSPEMQKKMFTALTCQQVISLSTGHSPFFSAPGELVRHLTSL